jgi:hypothetical protein
LRAETRQIWRCVGDVLCVSYKAAAHRGIPKRATHDDSAIAVTFWSAALLRRFCIAR